jgi:hypothetical protein
LFGNGNNLNSDFQFYYSSNPHLAPRQAQSESGVDNNNFEFTTDTAKQQQWGGQNVPAFLNDNESPWVGLQHNGATSGSFNINAANSFQATGSEAGSYPSAPLSDSGYASVPMAMPSQSRNSNESVLGVHGLPEKRRKKTTIRDNNRVQKTKKISRPRATSHPGVSTSGLICPFKDRPFEDCDEVLQCPSALKYVHLVSLVSATTICN